MLRPPHKRYQTLFLYAFSGTHPALRDLPDPDFIGCWEEEDLTVLFFHRAKPNLSSWVEKNFGLSFELSAEVPFEEWGEGRRGLKPFRIGPLTFAPVWNPCPGALLYDPGVVFGSGTHPTTRMMLEALWELWKIKGPFQKVWDLGCGSGLLTLAATKLGAQVWAVDRNPLCVRLTRHNLSLNSLSAQVLEGDVRSFLPLKADLILANLYKGLLLDLLGLPSFQQANYYLLSGFNSTMEKELRSVLDKGPFGLLKRYHKEGWVCLMVKKI